MIHWMFVINDSDQTFKERIKNRKWPIFAKTQNRDKIDPGHKVVFYKAGRINGQRFLGTATVISGVTREDGRIDAFVELGDIMIWKKPVQMREILDNLDFVRDKKNWGLYVQGGARQISEKDFLTISEG